MEQLEKDLTAGTNSHLVATYRLLADQKIRNRTQRLDESTRTVGGIGRQNTSNMGSPGVTQMVRINSSQDLSLSQNEDLHPILVEPSSGSLRARSCEDLSSTSLLALGTNRVEPSPAQVSSISMGSGFPFHSSNKNASRHNSLSNNAHSSIYSNQNAISQMTAQQNGDASPGLRRPQDGVLPAAFTMNRITTQSVPELRPSPA
ncbi:hypothetical protein SARC_02927 [Sphaeroforma arctica JP610]|uniref:Uncharacterized protein n=1 Tax=Sphaeroforma arctica JP610 TaxID=667725 RepID=A0A0L0G752_9EUKA|nr:hypothetical protein SARC_02927 [Sphaeroforma arctica JP610]KNC84867.1 hypothetical protein SARC_02927 [Sphaeroforma arctica JP610]|eukprot:XP_014158769.1 hypothetical protein SARC_02927 [Sphaeroforma arctica JP610]